MLLVPADVVAHVRADESLSNAVRETAIAAAEQLPQPGADRFNEKSWNIAKEKDASAEDYRRAVRWAEEGVRLAPSNPGILNTLGVAQYRVGACRDALETLKRSDEAHSSLREGGYPSDVAFLAMASHRAGETDAARSYLERLRTLMKHADFADDAERTALLQEAEALIR